MNSTNQTFSVTDVPEKLTHQIQIKEIPYFNTSSQYKIDIYTYKCQNTYECEPHKFTMGPGCYQVELYGASGGSQSGAVSAMRYSNTQTITQESIDRWGGNAVAEPIQSSGGAGGHVRGTICLRSEVQAFLHVGGKGGTPQGGYNGGGNGSTQYAGGGGGGSTDLRFEVDDVWHRVLVAAGGGGGDDSIGSIGSENDGSGGCGGGLEGQGMWINGVYNETHIATQSYGFSFFQGEAYTSQNLDNTFPVITGGERQGAGGGWFGGFSSHRGNGGGGGGSSFVLHADAEIPKGDIPLYTEQYTFKDTKPYAFTNKREYFFTEFAIVSGIRSGNGFGRITKIKGSWFDPVKTCIPTSLKILAVFGLCQI